MCRFHQLRTLFCKKNWKQKANCVSFGFSSGDSLEFPGDSKVPPSNLQQPAWARKINAEIAFFCSGSDKSWTPWKCRLVQLLRLSGLCLFGLHHLGSFETCLRLLEKLSLSDKTKAGEKRNTKHARSWISAQGVILPCSVEEALLLLRPCSFISPMHPAMCSL